QRHRGESDRRCVDRSQRLTLLEVPLAKVSADSPFAGGTFVVPDEQAATKHIYLAIMRADARAEEPQLDRAARRPQRCAGTSRTARRRTRPCCSSTAPATSSATSTCSTGRSRATCPPAASRSCRSSSNTTTHGASEAGSVPAKHPTRSPSLGRACVAHDRERGLGYPRSREARRTKGGVPRGAPAAGLA